MPIVIRQRLTSIDWEIDQLTTERSKLEAELERVGLQAAPYPNAATLNEIMEGNWHFKSPTPEARKVFKGLGVPLESCESFWAEDHFKYVEWHLNKAYTNDFLHGENKERELIIVNGRLQFA
jgi:hypothetical protein